MKTLKILCLNVICRNLKNFSEICEKRNLKLSYYLTDLIINQFINHFYPNSIEYRNFLNKKISTPSIFRLNKKINLDNQSINNLDTDEIRILDCLIPLKMDDIEKFENLVKFSKKLEKFKLSFMNNQSKPNLNININLESIFQKISYCKNLKSITLDFLSNTKYSNDTFELYNPFKNLNNLEIIKLNGNINKENFLQLLDGLKPRKKFLEVIHFDCNLNDTKTEICKFLSRCSRLEDVRINQAGLDKLPLYLIANSLKNSFHSLKQIRISGNFSFNFNGILQFLMNNCPNLLRIELHQHSHLSNDLEEHQRKLFNDKCPLSSSKLEVLKLSGYLFYDSTYIKILDYVKRCISLKKLDFKFLDDEINNNYTTINFNDLWQFTNSLREISIAGFEITETNCKVFEKLLKKCYRLEAFTLDFSFLENAGVSSIMKGLHSSSKNLKNLQISSIQSENSELLSFLTRSYSLESISIKLCRLKRNDFSAITNKLWHLSQNLQKLDLSACNLTFTDGVYLALLLKCCNNIRYINLMENKKLRNSLENIFDALLSSSNSLNHLLLGKCRLSFKGACILNKLLKNFHYLQVFNFCVLTYQNDITLDEIRKFGSSLMKGMGTIERINNCSASDKIFQLDGLESCFLGH